MYTVDQLPAEPSEAHFEISATAAAALGKLVDGNGLKADQVRLGRHDTLVHQIPARLIVTLKTDMVKSELKGKQPHGEVVPNATQAAANADAAIIEFLKSTDVIADILTQLEKKPEGGWGEKPFKLGLKSTGVKEYSSVDMCQKCKGQAKITCTTCTATGISPCQPCQGQGFTTCAICFGTGNVQQADGSTAQCTRCLGTRRVQCVHCNGARQMPCHICNGLTYIACKECEMSGYWTHIYHAKYHAECSFDLERKLIPPDVMQIIDIIGVPQLSSEEHAEIFALPPVIEGNKMYIPMMAFFAIAQSEFTVENRPFPATIAGLNGKIIDIPPLLDTFIKPGINALLKLSKGPMAAEALVSQACKYRLIKETLGGLAHNSKKAVYQKLGDDYPMVLSDKYAKAAVRYADVALLSLGNAPRTRGFFIGTALGAVVAWIYFAGIRMNVVATLKASGAAKHILLCDILVWVLGYVMTLVIIKFMAAQSIRSTLPSDVVMKEKGLPSAGNQGFWALPSIFIAWAVMAAISPVKPEWMITVLKAVGLMAR